MAKHILIGGNGYVGQHLSVDLHQMGEDVLVADIEKSELPIYEKVPFQYCDITDEASLRKLEITPDDIVYNLSARMLDPIPKRAERRDFFWPVNYDGVKYLLEYMDKCGCKQLVHFTTDMIYGHSVTVPQTEDHEAAPLGEYGASKLATEPLADEYRKKGFNITIFRPRLIIGPGRLGILQKLFKLVDYNLPIPMIGSGHNPYQFISVYDCADACVKAWKAGFPNEAYNLGSNNPPSIRKLLGRLISEANSKSFLLPTPAPLVKFALSSLDWLNIPLMDPEQYLIADEVCILDCSKAESQLGWVPRFTDDDMLISAYQSYHKKLNEDNGTTATSEA